MADNSTAPGSAAEMEEAQYDALTCLRLAYSLVRQMENDDTRREMIGRLYTDNGIKSLFEALLEKVELLLATRKADDILRAVSFATVQAWERGVRDGITECIAQCARHAGLAESQGESGDEKEAMRQ